MSLLLRNGDYEPDECGGFLRAAGADELLERVLFRLQARRGGFALLPNLGSRLYALSGEKAARRAALAKQYVEEALAEEADLRVESVLWDERNGLVEANLRLRDETLSLRLETGGTR